MSEQSQIYFLSIIHTMFWLLAFLNLAVEEGKKMEPVFLSMLAYPGLLPVVALACDCCSFAVDSYRL